MNMTLPFFSELILAVDDHPAMAQSHESGKTRRQYIADRIYLTTVRFLVGLGERPGGMPASSRSAANNGQDQFQRD